MPAILDRQQKIIFMMQSSDDDSFRLPVAAKKTEQTHISSPRKVMGRPEPSDQPLTRPSGFPGLRVALDWLDLHRIHENVAVPVLVLRHVQGDFRVGLPVECESGSKGKIAEKFIAHDSK